LVIAKPTRLLARTVAFTVAALVVARHSPQAKNLGDNVTGMIWPISIGPRRHTSIVLFTQSGHRAWQLTLVPAAAQS
jgi:hypothetical protein